MFKRAVTRLFFLVAPWIRWPFRSGRILIIRLDEIGDYILFRNFLQTLAHDDQWKRYRITLLGNVAFRDIGEALDGSYVSESIWIDPAALDNVKYLLSIIAKLKMRGFDLAINPIHSRAFVHDHLLIFSGSKKIIGSAGDLLGYDNDERKKIGDDYYDQLIPVPHHSQFEFFRNRAFFASLTGKEDHTAFALPFNKSPHINPSRINVVLFPGAGGVTRQWPPSSFASLIGIMEKNNPGAFQFIIAGGPGDGRLAAEIKASVNFQILDLTGKTSLIELIDLIGNCQLLISNESSPVHIAAATGVPAICISNGHHFRRFNPYPSELSEKIITVYPFGQFYSDDPREIDELVEACKIHSEIDIRLVTVERVVSIIKKRITDTSPIFFLTHFLR